MTAFPFQIVGFDLDGTFLDTLADLTAAVNHALGRIGRAPLSAEEVKPMIGGGAKLMLEHGLRKTGGMSEDDLEPLLDALLAYYEANIATHTQPFPGALAVLDALDAIGVHTAIVTNKRQRFARKLLDELGLFDRFACVIGGDTMGPGNAKPAAAPIIEMIARCGGGRAAFVGDSIYDTMAARNAGIPSIACSFGFLMQPIEELEADAVIGHFDELVPALYALG